MRSTIVAAVTLPGTVTRVGGVLEEIGVSGAASPVFPLLAASIFWSGEGAGSVDATAVGGACASAGGGSVGALATTPTVNLHAALLRAEICARRSRSTVSVS